MHWAELGVGILQGDQRAKQEKWLDQATLSMSKTRKVAICCAIKSPQQVEMGPKEASQKWALFSSFLPKKEERERKYNWWTKEVLSQAQPFVSYGIFSWDYDYIPYGVL